jgi:hypothetical protein
MTIKGARLTARGEMLLILALAGLVLSAAVGVYKVATSVWWTDSGYCFGSVEECYPSEREGK